MEDIPQDQVRHHVDTELVRLLVASSIKANTMVIVGSLLLVLLFSSLIPPEILLPWIAGMIVLALARLSISFAWKSGRISVGQCRYGYVALTAVMGFGWAGMALLPGAFVENHTIAIVYLVSVGIIIMGNNLLHMNMTALTMYISPLPLAIAWAFISTGHEWGTRLIVMLLAFLAFMLWIGWQNNRSLRNTLSLQFINEGLIERLKLSNEKANAASEAKSRFLANMSHEIRTPLNAVLGLSRMLQSTGLNDQQKSLLDALYSSSENLLDLLNDILDLSKIEARQLHIEYVPFSVKSLLDEVQLTMMPLAREKDIELIFESPAPSIPEYIEGDKVRMRQILINLVSNAIKFTDHGCVTVSAGTTRLAEDDRLVISVADTGIGIPPDQAEYVFENFSQLDESTARKHGGTGLGLTICKQLVELMGGDIRFDSVVGNGTTFDFAIPLRPARELPEDELLDTDLPRKKLDHILLVEDSEVNRMIVAYFLESDGYMVTEAANGMLALEALAVDRFDLILMDVQMPVMDGFDAVRILRAVETGAPLENALPDGLEARLRDRLAGGQVPVIALTAHALSGDRERCMQAGMNRYLTKPVTGDRLIRAIRRIEEKAVNNSDIHVQR